MEEQKPTQPRRRGSLFGPLLLIALGLVFLLRNLGYLQNDIWSSLWQLWPIVLIVIGLDNIYKREGLAGAAFLIGLGVVFLLANFGYLALDVWRVVINLWPVLIIAVGFDLIVGRKSLWASIAGLVVVLAILAGALWLYGFRQERGQVFSGQDVQQALGGAGRGQVELSMGAGELKVHSNPQADMLISGKVSTGRSNRLVQDSSMEGNVAIYRLRDNGVTMMFPGSDYVWDLGLSGAIPLDLKVNFGAGGADLNLENLQLEALEASMGVGTTMVILPGEGTFRGEISGAIGTVEILVPDGMEVRIIRDTALASLNVPNDYLEQNDIYLSPGYEGAQNRIDLQVSMAIGSVNIRSAP